MDTVVPVQNKNFSGDGREFTKVSPAVRKTESHVHLKFLWIWQTFWRIIMETPNVNTSSIRDEWHCWKSSAQNRGRNICSLVGNFARLKSEWLILSNVTAICEMSKTSWQTGNALGKDDVENHSFKGPVFPFDSIVEYHPLSAIWWENVTRNIAWICTVCGENLERRLSKCRPWGAVKNWTLRSPRSKTQCKGNDNVQNWWKNIFPIADCTAKLLGRDHEVQQATPRQYHPVGSEDLLRRFSGKRGWVSANITTWWRWSPKRLLVDRWRLHSSSSHRTLSSSPRAERRIISNFTKVFWRDQDNSHKSGGVARKTCQRPLECWWNPARVMDSIHAAHVVDGEASSRICVFRGALDKDSSNYQAWLFVAWDLDCHVESSHYRKSKNGLWRNQRSTTLDNWEASTLLILKMKSLKRPWTCKKQVGRSHGRCCALQHGDKKSCLEVTGNCSKWEY